MSELSRFRLSRAPQRLVPRPARIMQLLLTIPPIDHGTTLTVMPTPEVHGVLQKFRTAARTIPLVPSSSGSEEILDSTIYALDQWLTAHGNRPSVSALREWLAEAQLVSIPAGWSAVKLQLIRTLVTLMTKQFDPSYSTLVTRYLLVMGLVELNWDSPETLASPEDIHDALRWRTIVLPPIAELHAALDVPTQNGLPDPRAVLARRPGFTDLFIIEEEWNRYEAGEISYIENVLAGEEKVRQFTHVDISKVETTEESAETTVEERDTQTTNRADLKDESTAATKLALHVEAKVDTTGQYGPAQISAHVGGSLDYSSEETSSHAVTLSKEVVSRALSRVEEHVSTMRKTVNEVKNIDFSKHAFKNTSEAAVAGVYRWVNKVQRVRTVKYPHRFMLEFEVPEPGAWYRWLHASDGLAGLTNAPPIPLTLDGMAASAANPVLNPADVTADNYLKLGARYFTAGLQPPPQRVTVSGTVKQDSVSGDPSSDKQFLKYVSENTLTVPSGYRAVAWRAAAMSWTNWDQTAKTPLPKSWTPADEYKEGALNDGSMFLSVGASEPYQKYAYGNAGPIRTVLFSGTGHDMGPITSGTVPVSIMTNSLNGIVVNVELDCDPTPEATVKWQIQTYEQIAGAYAAMKQAYEDELASRQVRTPAMSDANSPAQNALIIQEELKKQVIAQLTGNRFGGPPAVKWDGSGTQPPTLLPAAAAASAPVIQFLEQAFEWENLTYMLYGYFWGDPARW